MGRLANYKSILLKLGELEEMRLIAYENVVIYKGRTKRYHIINLMRRDFQIGKKVFLYNSQLWLFLGKLKSRWYDLFIVNKVFASDVIEIQNTRDSHTFTVNNQRLKIYARGEILVEIVSLMLADP